MRTRRLLLPLLVIALPAVILAGQKADLRLLHRIERVDGRGSGLDADTVRGLTPEQMTETAASRSRASGSTPTRAGCSSRAGRSA